MSQSVIRCPSNRIMAEPCLRCHDCRLVLDRPVMEAICGGLGEIAQICVLYPLETIKVGWRMIDHALDYISFARETFS